jgi:hypothetical protein
MYFRNCELRYELFMQFIIIMASLVSLSCHRRGRVEFLLLLILHGPLHDVTISVM